MLDVIFVAIVVAYFGLNVACAFAFDRFMGGKK
jgi:hypothetical protein